MRWRRPVEPPNSIPAMKDIAVTPMSWQLQFQKKGTEIHNSLPSNFRPPECENYTKVRARVHQRRL
jgi:hypothetical protein